jgi:hypothetical protein
MRDMERLNKLSQTLGGMPFEALVAIVVLAGFALAGYAIYAVVTVIKERR